MENVPGLIGLFKGKYKEFILSEFSDAGYTVSNEILNAADYGVPQLRNRIFFVGFQDKYANFFFPQPTHFEKQSYLYESKNYVTCREALSDLPALTKELGDEQQSYKTKPVSEYQRLMRSGSSFVYNHIAVNHAERIKRIISLVPEGGNYRDLPEKYRNTRKFNIAWSRYHGEKPSKTIDTGHRHYFHYKYNRVPTVREHARLQSFPDNYIFYGNRTQQNYQVGNAVPPLLAKAIASEIQKCLDNSLKNANNFIKKGEANPQIYYNKQKENVDTGLKIYRIPDDYFFRIHHPRPRFKNNVENVLIYIASEIYKLGKMEKKRFMALLNEAIWRFPGNETYVKKTIDNWRTEISSLFGLVEYSFSDKTCKPSTMAKILAENEDVIEFFKYFCYYFQYPGAHIKPHSIIEQIKARVRFKPVKYILELLHKAEETTGNRFGLSKAEATHCIFNDLRVTRDHRSVDTTLELIISNRQKKLEYITKGDVIRYAGDILDYMVLADLLVKRGKIFYLNKVEIEVISSFLESDVFFNMYEPLYNKKTISTSDVNIYYANWFHYINRNIEPGLFQTDLFKFLNINRDEYDQLEELNKDYSDHFYKSLESGHDLKTKDIGNFGEHLVFGHECMRLKIGKKEFLIRKIVKIPDQFGLGYDIRSVELDETDRLVEVKSTISHGSLDFNKFHLTRPEWSAADSHRKRYFVYRLMISKNKKKLFIIQDPVGAYMADDGRLTAKPSDGMDITFTNRAGNWEELLLWEN